MESRTKFLGNITLDGFDRVGEGGCERIGYVPDLRMMYGIFVIRCNLFSKVYILVAFLCLLRCLALISQTVL
jgi:hypothetical protein